MWKSDTPLRCAQCAEVIETLDDFGLCIVCDQAFCSQHLVLRAGVANCATCEEIRQDREENGPVPQAAADRVAHLLELDLRETIGAGHESVVEEAVSRIRMFAHDAPDFEQRVVDDVQQYLHDTFVDTSWPACPHHPNHPLWYSDGWWSCDETGQRAAPLGGLCRTAG